MTDVFIIGCGYVGRRLARAEQARGRSCAALTHSEPSAAELAALGIRPILGDLDRPESLADLDLRDAIAYYLVPPAASGVTDLRSAHFCDALDADRAPRFCG